MTSTTDPSAAGGVAESLLDAFCKADFDRMRSLLDEKLVAFITTADGGLDRVDGRDGYLRRIQLMDLPSAQFSIELTQPPVQVDADRVLIMVEVRAHRGSRSLHNYAAHLLRVTDDRVSEWHMVDAKPAESERFWS